MLAPILGIIFTFILASQFVSTSLEQRQAFAHTQKITMDNSRLFSQLATRLATNHAQVYQLLKFAESSDESRLYKIGKPLLNEVHRIELDTRLAAKNIDSTEALLHSLSNYRKTIITSVEMSTVDLSLAYKFMTQATSEFNATNSQFLKLNGRMQKNIEEQLINFHQQANDILQKYTTLFFIAILVVIIISFLLARILSHDLQQSINTLSKLTSNEDLIDNRSEVTQLSQVIKHVQENHQKLKKTRHDLSQKESQLRSILDNMVDGVITMDESGIVLTFNKAAENMFGYTAAQMFGKSIDQLMSKQDAGQHSKYLQNYLTTGEKNIIGTGREVKAMRRNGCTFPIHLSVTELPNKINNKRCFIGSCKDITVSKQQEQQIRRSQKMDALGKLTGGIAHDYNNMLGVILGYADLLTSVLTDQPEKTNYVNKIIHAAERGAKLTSKLLAFSQLKQTDAEKLDLNNLLINQHHMLEKTLTVRIKLVFDLHSDLWAIKVDIGELEDAILNICINAMHSMEHDGQLTIQTQNFTIEKENIDLIELHPGDYVRLNFNDTGHGMSEETMSKIFDPFYSTKGDKGNGLGLSQVYGFIERSNGAIKVYSEPGHGTRFALYFPRLIEESHDTQIEKPEVEINLQGNESILVVDDEPELLNLCYGILKQNGYTVFKANDALQALDILEQENIDLLLSDVIMPDMDGFKLAARVQKDYPHIKIQLTSGFSDNRHTIMDDKSIHENLIHKPYNSQTLLKRIRELFTQ